jgi:hypothetical protein
MKKSLQRVIGSAVTSLLLAFLFLVPNGAAAWPNQGGSCTTCHSTPGGSLIATPDPLEIEPGNSGLLTFDITDLGGSEDTRISVQGLDNLDLDATVDPGGDNWTFVNGSGGKSYISDNITSTRSYTLSMLIGANAISGDYPIVVMYAGNGLRGAETSFTLRVISEPPVLTIVPAGVGFASISWPPDSHGFVLQETLSLSLTNWVNSPSGTNNPVVFSTTARSRFYRLNKP